GVSRNGEKNFFVSPLMENCNAREYLERLKTDGVSELFDIARGLKYQHDNDIRHLDVKPDNAIFDGQHRALVTDFGTCIVRELEGKDHGTGTRLYMSPERLRGEVPTPKANVFAFAITMFEV
ncbi:kinase-like protein, partial [Gonapodya prolifera JEL478]